MSSVLPDHFPSLGIPISRLDGIIEDLGGAAKAGALSCGDFYAKCIRPVCKGNGLPLAQHILMKDESTRTGRARCGPADTLVIQGGGHGFLDTCSALTLHLRQDIEFCSEPGFDAPTRKTHVSSIAGKCAFALYKLNARSPPPPSPPR
jgi:hypothetical protein